MTDAQLLGPNDPPAFTLLNEGGSAQLLLTCDHASRAIPASLANLGLDEAALARHIAWDIGAAEVTRLLAEGLGAPAILAGYSRLAMDLNRRPQGEGSIAPVSDGTAVPGNQGLSPEDAAARQAAIFDPYHSAIGRRIDRGLAGGRPPVA